MSGPAVLVLYVSSSSARRDGAFRDAGVVDEPVEAPVRGLDGRGGGGDGLVRCDVELQQAQRAAAPVGDARLQLPQRDLALVDAAAAHDDVVVCRGGGEGVAGVEADARVGP